MARAPCSFVVVIVVVFVVFHVVVTRSDDSGFSSSARQERRRVADVRQILPAAHLHVVRGAAESRPAAGRLRYRPPQHQQLLLR